MRLTRGRLVALTVGIGLQALLLCGCAAEATKGSASAASSPAAPAALRESIHWYRDSAEQKAVYIAVYRSATAGARALSATLAPRSWAVIVDVDETILDNSDYEKAQALSGAGFSQATWAEWVARMAAPRLPGAKEFIDAVRGEMKGQVILVTNRKEDECAATEENLRRQEIQFDRILCDRVGDGNKNPRFRSVTDGTPGNPPLKVLIWVGDNIQDFPNLTQASPGNPGDFGVRYFVLPNPMYGSWQKVPAR
jgi:5'-nucleotidase (lipoprotein e(P4) family)